MAEVADERENKRTSGLSCGNHLDIDWRQMEGFDIKGFKHRCTRGTNKIKYK